MTIMGTPNKTEFTSLSEATSAFLKSQCENDDFYMVIATKITTAFPHGGEYLLQHIDRFDEIRARAAIFALSHHYVNSSTLVEKLLKLTRDNRYMVISEAIDGLAEIGAKNEWPKIKDFLSHESPYVRGATLRFASKQLSQQVSFKILINALEDHHFIVIENAIDELSDLGMKEALPFIEKFTNYSNEDIREAARDAVDYLKKL